MMRAKNFSLIIVAFVFSLVVLAGFLHSQYLVYNENIMILHYQLNKLKKSSSEKIETVIIGDSSAGNAIDAQEFSKLSHTQTLNLALTGSYGLIGSLNMLQRVLSEHKELKNVIIMHSLDVWYRPLSLTSYFKTRSRPLQEMSGMIDDIYSQYLAYLLNIKELNWFVKSLAEELECSIDIQHDFLKQKPHTFANGKHVLKKSKHLHSEINEDKMKVLKMIDDLCEAKKLHCIYLHGALHVSLVEEDSTIVKNINKKLSETMKSISFNPHPFALSADKLGDSNDHVDISYKLESTKESYNNAFKGKF